MIFSISGSRHTFATVKRQTIKTFNHMAFYKSSSRSSSSSNYSVKCYSVNNHRMKYSESTSSKRDTRNTINSQVDYWESRGYEAHPVTSNRVEMHRGYGAHKSIVTIYATPDKKRW